MINFAAIDFETANGKRTSVCSVGVVIVREGKITNKIYRLIRPRPNYYTQWTTAVHGLTYDDTMEADEFPEVWAEIKPLIDGLPLVAHNSPFDEGCLRAVHELYDMTYPDYKFYCTCRTSRKVFGKDLPNHQLHTVAERCGYHLENHHHALADAEACAQIALLIIPEPKKERKTKKVLSYIFATVTLIVSIIIKDNTLSNILLLNVIIESICISRVAYKITKNEYGYENYLKELKVR